MPVLKKLYNACKDSFTPTGPISEEALEKVQAILGWRISYNSTYSLWTITTLLRSFYFLLGTELVNLVGDLKVDHNTVWW